MYIYLCLSLGFLSSSSPVHLSTRDQILYYGLSKFVSHMQRRISQFILDESSTYKLKDDGSATVQPTYFKKIIRCQLVMEFHLKCPS